TIIGGTSNAIDKATNASIIGGVNNSLSTNANNSIILGGIGNTVSGANSLAFGMNTTVDSANSIAMGNAVSTSGRGAWALGNGSTASGMNSFSYGNQTIADTNYAFSLGNNSVASGLRSFSIGNSSTITGDSSYIVGNTGNVTGSNSFVFGKKDSISGDHSFAIGTNSIVRGDYSIALGNNVVNNEDNSFVAQYSGGFVFKSTGSTNDHYVAEFNNTAAGGGKHGLKISLNNSTPDNTNEFMTFQNALGNRVGRIRGQTLANMYASDSYIEQKNLHEKTKRIKEETAVTSGLVLAVKTKKAIQKGIEVAGSAAEIADAAASTAATLGAGSGWTANTVVEMAFKLAQAIPEATEAMIAGYQEGHAIAEAANAEEVLDHWIDRMNEQVGVTYESGSADYAEWLPKDEHSIDFKESEIVGIHKGKIKYETEGAEQLMVVSSRPMILGNMQTKDKEQSYEAVAFMGQVPVSILGVVTKGDFILPSGGNHGLGIAVHPDNMRDEDYKNIVGIAWSDARDTFAINKVNVAVGLNTTTLAHQINKQSNEIAALKKTMAEIVETLNSLNQNQNTRLVMTNNPELVTTTTMKTFIDPSTGIIKSRSKNSLHTLYKECLTKYNAIITSQYEQRNQFHTSMIEDLEKDPIFKELYLYSLIQRLNN
ncbi:MAG: hypothetical protein ACKOFB_04030, partial [bacterium]